MKRFEEGQNIQSAAQALPLSLAEVWMKRTALVFAALGVCAMVACQQKGAMGPAGPAGAPGAPGTPATRADGGSVGGGGWARDNADRLLAAAKTELVASLRRAAPEIFAALPQGWNQSRLANVIENVRDGSALPPAVRSGRLLMMDYGRDARGEFIVMLNPFYDNASTPDIRYTSLEQRKAAILSLQTKLLHEAVHLWFEPKNDEDDQRAERIAVRFIHALQRNVIVCSPGPRPTDAPPLVIDYGNGTQVPARVSSIVIHRALGFVDVPGLRPLDFGVPFAERVLSDVRRSEGYLFPPERYPGGENSGMVPTRIIELDNGRQIQFVGTEVTTGGISRDRLAEQQLLRLFSSYRLILTLEPSVAMSLNVTVDQMKLQWWISEQNNSEVSNLLRDNQRFNCEQVALVVRMD